jgi:hypothetical protein
MRKLTSLVVLWCRAWSRIIVTGLLALCGTAAHAAVVQYATTSLGGDFWRYAYTLEGQAPTGGFDGVTIYFEPTSFGTLTNLVAPPGWDPLIVQPDTGLPADGFVDLLHSGGLLSGTVGPVAFSVDVEYLGTGVPGAQRFELYVSNPFSVVASGLTQQASNVPEPATVVLLALALGCAVLTQAQPTRRANREG